MSDRMASWLDDVRVLIYDESRWDLIAPNGSLDDFPNVLVWFAILKELDEDARALRRRLKVVVLPDLDQRDPQRLALVGIGKALSEICVAKRIFRNGKMRKDRDRSARKVLKGIHEHVVEVAGAVKRCRDVFREAEHPFDAPENEFRRDGAKWVLRYGGESARIKDYKGLAYLAESLARPNQYIPAPELIQRVDGMAATSEDDKSVAILDEDRLSVVVSGAGPPIDRQTAAAYRKGLEEARADAEDAEARGDDEAAKEAWRRLDQLKKEMSRNYNYAGRERDPSDPRERSRKAVYSVINRAIKRIDNEMPLLAKHLRESVKNSGGSFVYNPEHSADWVL